jgi:tetratricopeptide (TPR) repeat protein
MITRASAIPATLALIGFLGGGTRLSAQSSDADDVKRLIREETESYYRHDADAWKATWIQDSTAIRTGTNSGAYGVSLGWDKFGPATVDAIRKDPTPQSIRLETSNYSVRTDGSLAWAEYDQRIMFSNDSVPYVSREQRTLVKRDGAWKILSAGTYDFSSYAADPRAVQYRLNRTGHDLSAAKKHREAIAVLKLNAQLHPDMSVAYRGLADAYAAAGETKLAIQSYTKSAALDPKNEEIKVALAKLRGSKSP